MYEKILKDEYGICPDHINETKGGFSAKAYKVQAGNRFYFLKVYDKSLPTMQPFIRRIDYYMPLLARLASETQIAENVVKPVLTKTGAFKYETDANAFLLFDFEEGETPGRKLTAEQTAELAGIIAQLHQTDKKYYQNLTGLSENLSLPFCENLPKYLHESEFRVLTENTELILDAVKETLYLKESERMKCGDRSVLCHGDAHNFNLIQGNKLILCDWEDLRAAPPEADLFIYLHMDNPHWDIFIETYKQTRSGFVLNEKLLRFYQLRRILEDIAIDIERLTLENPSEAEEKQALEWISLSVGSLKGLM
jgi:aminoglycoside phosphotransferase (APT) family kinase protein